MHVYKCTCIHTHNLYILLYIHYIHAYILHIYLHTCTHIQVKIGQHAYSCLFGTFLGNSMKERDTWRVEEDTTPIWSFLNEENEDVINYLFWPPSQGEMKVKVNLFTHDYLCLLY